MLEDLAIPAIFFGSGAAGLVFEIVWFYRCGLVFGSSVWAASITVSSFMGGLAIGNGLVGLLGDRVRRPLRAYAAAEAIVAAAGVAVVYALSKPIPIPSRVAIDAFWTINAMRLTVTFTALLLPATAMGATLPLLVSEVCRWHTRFGVVLGRLYGWNTLGAVCGAIGAEVVLVRRAGVTGSAWIAALLDCAAATSALWLAGRARPPAPREPRRISGSASRVPPSFVVAAGIAGANLLALEVLWFRFLSMYVLSTTFAMSVMLAVVLAGIGLGGLIASRWLARAGRADISTVALAAGCAVVISYTAFQTTTGAQVGDWRRIVWFGMVLAFPTSVASGALFTFIGERIAWDSGPTARAAAVVTAANTAGAMLGPLLASFVLLPRLGMERTFFGIAASYGAVAIVARERPRRAAGTRVVLAAAAAFVVLLLAFPFGLMANTYFVRAAAPYAGDGSQIVATREGASDTIFLMRQSWMGRPVYERLVTNGYSMSGTAVAALRYMRAFVYLPMLLHGSPLRRILVVCYGVGVTAGAATDVPSAESIDVVEISRDIAAVSDVVQTGAHHPLRDPRVRLHLEDGRYFLATTRQRFDLITGEPPPPRTPGAVNIYTRDYFRLVHDRLNDGGTATYWLPIARPDPGTDVMTILRAFCDVFEDCSLWNATPFDIVLVGSRRAGAPPDAAAFAERWASQPLADRLGEIGLERPGQLGAMFLGDAAFARDLAGDAPPLTDDFPQRLVPDPARLSLSDPRYRTSPAAASLYRRTLDVDRARRAFLSSASVRGWFPPALIADTVPFFDVQRIVNRVLGEGGRPLRLIEDLDAVLTGTSLETLPLWILGSDGVRQRIATSADAGTGAALFARGLGQLAGRKYFEAASLFGSAEQLGVRDAALRPLLVYALCRGGNVAGGARLARGAASSDADAVHFWEWMRAQFGVGPDNQ